MKRFFRYGLALFFCVIGLLSLYPIILFGLWTFGNKGWHPDLLFYLLLAIMPSLCFWAIRHSFREHSSKPFLWPFVFGLLLEIGIYLFTGHPFFLAFFI